MREPPLCTRRTREGCGFHTIFTTARRVASDSPPFAFDCLHLTGQITERIWDDVIGLQPTNVRPTSRPQPRPTHEPDAPRPQRRALHLLALLIHESSTRVASRL